MRMDINDIQVGRRQRRRNPPEKRFEFSNYRHNNRPILAPAAPDNKAVKTKNRLKAADKILLQAD